MKFKTGEWEREEMQLGGGVHEGDVRRPVPLTVGLRVWKTHFAEERPAELAALSVLGSKWHPCLFQRHPSATRFKPLMRLSASVAKGFSCCRVYACASGGRLFLSGIFGHEKRICIC